MEHVSMSESGYKIYISDIESSGLDKNIHEVIEISMLRFSLFDKSFPEEQKTWLLRALNPATIEDQALAINGHKKADILWQTDYGRQNYKEPKDVIAEIENWMMTDNVSVMDRIFAGQNPDFDTGFLTTGLWDRYGYKDTFPFAIENGNRVLDTKQLALLVDLCTGKRREFYNLGSLVKAFGVKKGKAHQAAEDTRMTKDLLVKIVDPIKEEIAKKHHGGYDE